MKGRILGALSGPPKHRDRRVNAWITFDGSGATIADSHNISSYTNNAAAGDTNNAAAGDWTITVANGFATDYAVAGLARYDGAATTALFGGQNVVTHYPTLTSFRLGLVSQATGGAVDGTYVSAVAVGSV
jgi:hypothetical protein